MPTIDASFRKKAIPLILFFIVSAACYSPSRGFAEEGGEIQAPPLEKKWDDFSTDMENRMLALEKIQIDAATVIEGWLTKLGKDQSDLARKLEEMEKQQKNSAGGVGSLLFFSDATEEIGLPSWFGLFLVFFLLSCLLLAPFGVWLFLRNKQCQEKLVSLDMAFAALEGKYQEMEEVKAYAENLQNNIGDGSEPLRKLYETEQDVARIRQECPKSLAELLRLAPEVLRDSGFFAYIFPYHARLAMIEKNWGEAAFFWNKYLVVAPENSTVLYLAGWCLLQQGMGEKDGSAAYKLFMESHNSFSRISSTPDLPDYGDYRWHWADATYRASLFSPDAEQAQQLKKSAEGFIWSLPGQDGNAAMKNWVRYLWAFSQETASPELSLRVLDDVRMLTEEMTTAVPSDDDAWNTRGSVFLEIAARTELPASKRGLYHDAITAFYRSATLNKENSAAWGNWGRCLSALAELESEPKKRRDVLLKAKSRYEKAAAITAENDVILSNWGTCLFELAALTSEADKKRALLMEASARQERAVALNDHNGTAWYYWGSSLAGIADFEADEEKKRVLLLEASLKHERAAAINGSSYASLNDWGKSLVALAEIEADEDRARAMLLEAKGMYEKAITLGGEDGPASYNLGLCLSSLAKLEIDMNKKRPLLLEASTRHGKAVSLNEADDAAWNIWGFSLFSLAELEPDLGKKRELLTEAGAKFEQATTLNTANQDAWNNWGNCLSSLAQLESNAEKKRNLLFEAFYKRKRASTLNERMHSHPQSPGLNLH